MRHYYALQYPRGFNRLKPTYPYTVTVYRYTVPGERDRFVMAANALNDRPIKYYRRIPGDHPLTEQAKNLAARGMAWPITMSVVGLVGRMPIIDKVADGAA